MGTIKKIYMKKTLLFTLSILFIQNVNAQTDNTIEKKRLDYANKLLELRGTFESFEKSKPFGNKRIPPNEFNKEDFLNTMDPVSGTIPTQNVLDLQRRIKAREFSPTVNNRVSFLSNSNPLNSWVERGPYKVGGRVRAIMFDPNDATGKRVFGAGVTGGLWVNNDYTNENSEWNPIDDFMANTSIVSLAYDPNNTQIMYASTGEVQALDLIGQGIFKSTDGGQTWNSYYFPSPTASGNVRRSVYFVNNIVVRNNNGVSEVYFGVSDGYFNNLNHGTDLTGLYKATRNGTPVKIADNTIGLAAIEEIKIGADNSIWVSTRANTRNVGGGQIFKSTDGENFSNVYNANIPSSRVVIGLSATNANKAFALLQGGTNEPVRIIKTTNGGQTWLSSAIQNSGVTIPINPLPQMNPNDFTRNQSFYDLHITVDPENDDKVFAGGIDLHKSNDGGATWDLISAWHSFYSNQYFEETGIKVPEVHADQHTAVFNPKNQNHLLFGNDGGIYFAENKNNIVGDFNSVKKINNRFNVTQFYDGKLNPVATPTNEYILAGAQDNGTQRLFGTANTNNFYQETEQYGGDGAENEFDDEGKYIIYSYVRNTHIIENQTGQFYLLQSQAERENYGHFINKLTVDRKNDIFYSFHQGLTLNRISNLMLQNPNQGFVNSRITIATPLSGENISELTSSPYNTTTSSLVLAGTNFGRIIKIKNGHTTTPSYEVLNTPISSAISSIRFGNTNNDILVTVSNFNQVSVYYSNDGGITWLNKEGNLPDIPVRTIFMNPDNNNEVILGTDLGIWGTANFDNSYPSWSQYNEIIGNVKVTNFDYRPSTKTLLASTYGRGVFTTQLGENLSTSTVNLIEKKFTIYPNPTRNPFNVEFDDIKYKNVDAQIFDFTGKLVKTFKNIKSKENHLLNLPSGSYVVNFISNNSTIYTSQLLVK